jgi:small subunit ribosomal protein S7
MPRRAEITPRPVISDPVYDSQLVTQLMNRVMRDGKKSTAEAIVYSALDKVGEKTGRPPVEVLEQAVKTVTPVLEVRSRRVGGANYQVRREKHMDDKLAGEILDALEQQGSAYKRKDDMYRMAQANKAFAHYRW